MVVRHDSPLTQWIVVVGAVCVFLVWSTPALADVDQAWDHWRRGDVAEAHGLAAASLSDGGDRARHLLVLTSLVQGQYEQALDHYGRLDPSYERRIELDSLIVEALIAVGRADLAVSFARRQGLSEGKQTWISTRSRHPLRVTLDATTVVPFVPANLLRDWMPAVLIEINGREMLGHLDTGGAFLAVSPRMAASLAIETTLVGTGVANDAVTTVEMGLADRLAIGDAVLENVPVAALASLQGALQGGGEIEDMVILGTKILEQFLSTWDNERQRLVLSPRRDPASRAEHFAEIAPPEREMEFFMLPDHYLFASGTVAGKEIPVFVDTGLVAIDGSRQQAGALASLDSLILWGTDGRESPGGFVVSPGPIGLGPLQQEGVLVKVGEWEMSPHGLDLPMLLGYGFMRFYSWTIDFDRYRWFFSGGPEETPESEMVAETSDLGGGSAAPPVADQPFDTDVQSVFGARRRSQVAAGELVTYVGQYRVTEKASLVVTTDGEDLFLLAPGQPKMPLQGEPDGGFSIPLVDATVTFTRDDAGEILGLVLVQGARSTRAEKIR